MNILICGANGFVGKNLTYALRAKAHTVIRAVRNPTEVGDIAVDFMTDIDAQTWLPRLQHVDVVINTVGVLRDSRKQAMQKLHNETPCALFSACASMKIKRVVQISALGIESDVNVPYFFTRRVAEHALQKLPEHVKTLCLRPSVIYGEDGASAQLFLRMAKLPLQVLPMGGVQGLQPVHISDLCLGIQNWLDDSHASSLTINAVGAEATTMRGMLDSYRTQLQHQPAWHISLPQSMVKLAARIGDFIPQAPLCSDTYAMLAAGNTASSLEFSKLLGVPPKSFKHFIPSSRF